jgi:hypothetical protein
MKIVAGFLRSPEGRAALTRALEETGCVTVNCWSCTRCAAANATSSSR